MMACGGVRLSNLPLVASQRTSNGLSKKRPQGGTTPSRPIADCQIELFGRNHRRWPMRAQLPSARHPSGIRLLWSGIIVLRNVLLEAIIVVEAAEDWVLCHAIAGWHSMSTTTHRNGRPGRF